MVHHFRCMHICGPFYFHWNQDFVYTEIEIYSQNPNEKKIVRHSNNVCIERGIVSWTSKFKRSKIKMHRVFFRSVSRLNFRSIWFYSGFAYFISSPFFLIRNVNDEQKKKKTTELTHMQKQQQQQQHSKLCVLTFCAILLLNTIEHAR